jgi:very-short-patch-repair endonuclease
MSKNYIGSEEHKENFKKAGILGNKKIQKLKQKRIEEFNKNPKKCKGCNFVFDYRHRHNSFCSKSCAVSFNNKNRKLGNDTKSKIKKALKGRQHETKKLTKDYEVKICLYCKVEFITRKKKQKYCSLECARKSIFSNEDTKKKISVKIQERMTNGTFVGWKIRKLNDASYPEKYFINLFIEKQIENYKREYRVGKWFIDFAFIDKKIALEIDGSQHESNERKIKDSEKDEFLKKEGWKVFRIKWCNPINNFNKEKLYEQIKNFEYILYNK